MVVITTLLQEHRMCFKIWDPLCIVRVPNWPTPLIIVVYQPHEGVSIKAIRSHSFEFHYVEKDKNGN